jgi:flotillin
MFALDIPGGAGTAIVAIVGIILVVFINLAIWVSRYTKVGPNQVLIVSGRQNRYVDSDGSVRTIGFRVVKGGGTFVWPVIEKVDALSLEVLTVNVRSAMS